MEKICDVKGCNEKSFQTVPADLAGKVFSLKEEKNFKAFFQVRFEKIGKYSVYDEIEEYLYNMSPEEKNIALRSSSNLSYLLMSIIIITNTIAI